MLIMNIVLWIVILVLLCLWIVTRRRRLNASKLQNQQNLPDIANLVEFGEHSSNPHVHALAIEMPLEQANCVSCGALENCLPIGLDQGMICKNCCLNSEVYQENFDEFMTSVVMGAVTKVINEEADENSPRRNANLN